MEGKQGPVSLIPSPAPSVHLRQLSDSSCDLVPTSCSVLCRYEQAALRDITKEWKKERNVTAEGLADFHKIQVTFPPPPNSWSPISMGRDQVGLEPHMSIRLCSAAA
eukprot:981162-Rhodomonas_salina.6